MPFSASLAQLSLDAVEATAREAGALAMGFFRDAAPTSAKLWHKAGHSPVTEADMAVDAFLRERLMALGPDFHWLSEEAAPTALTDDRPVWIVDPIDGTRAFAAGEQEWGVSIGLVHRGLPVLACFFMPARERLYRARAGSGAFCNGAPLPLERGADCAAGPKPVLDPFLALKPYLRAHPKIPSLAARISYVAEGRLAYGIASHGAHEWDLAAADLLLREAGGRLTDLTGAALVYTGEARKLPVLLASRSASHAADCAALLKKHAAAAEHFTNSQLAK